ncbi:MAG: DUF4139 domain-containing protein [Rhodospirillaceae bacterium]|nr:DUF4139 domain-containing protein [Rhodospirillaceae bacterium]
MLTGWGERSAPRGGGWVLALLLGLGAAGGAAAAEPAERPVPLSDQTGVAVTIYNGNLALVKDRRQVSLDQGANRLAFIDVSAEMRPETALLTAPGGGIELVEQNFNFDLLTPRKILEKSVGSMVRVVVTNPQTGAETVEDARVLSVADGVVLQIGDRIETNPPGRIVFAEVPPKLRARPTLVLDLDSRDAGTQELELSYLTGGLGWHADYVAELEPDEKSLDLNGWVTLTNTSGTTYRDAQLQLVAGTVNVVRPPEDRRVMAMAAEAAPAPAMAEESVFEYHLYTLQHPTTLEENQTKQVALLSGQGVPVRKEYRLDDIAHVLKYPMGEPRRVNATVRIAFDNSEAGRLGLPLPKGVVRVYKRDSRGQMIFLGEDSIDHTPKNESVRLNLGQAFDVTARARQTEFEQLGEETFESAYAIEIKNAKSEPVTVTVSQAMPGTWTILQESLPHTKTDAFRAEWQVGVAAEGSTTLTYRVRTKY